MDKLFWTYKGYLDSVLDTQKVPGLLSRVPIWDVSVLHWSRIAIPDKVGDQLPVDVHHPLVLLRPGHHLSLQHHLAQVHDVVSMSHPPVLFCRLRMPGSIKV